MARNRGSEVVKNGAMSTLRPSGYVKIAIENDHL
jgi:hypothetical protein